MESQPQGDGKHILDLTSMLGVDFKRQDIPVTVDANGLTITWNAPFEDSGVGAELEDLEVFLITHRLIVGGVDVFSEQVKLGMEVMS